MDGTNKIVNQEKFNKGKEDARKSNPPIDEDPDYVEGYAEECQMMMKLLFQNGKV